MAVEDPDKCKYFDLAQLVKQRANADGAIVIIIKDNDSRIAPDLPPHLLPYLPEILQSCALQSTAFLQNLVETELRPALEKLAKQGDPVAASALIGEPPESTLRKPFRHS